MKIPFYILPILFLMVMLFTACGERKNEQDQGIETELAGDEEDETPLPGEQHPLEYNPADTVVKLRIEELPPAILEFTQVLVNTYLDMEEALLQANAAEAKVKAEQLINMLQRHEQENVDLSPEVKHFFTTTTHVLRQSAQSILVAQDLLEIQSFFSAMSPAIYKLAKVSNPRDARLFYQFCSESFDNRGAYWLSRTKEIKNPYAAQDQQGCGKTIAVL